MKLMDILKEALEEEEEEIYDTNKLPHQRKEMRPKAVIPTFKEKNIKSPTPEGAIDDVPDWRNVKNESAPSEPMGEVKISKQNGVFVVKVQIPEVGVDLKFKGKNASEALMQLAQKMSRMGLWE